jgi:hypothetical protein
MRCLVCGSEEGTAGCTTAWKHGQREIPVFYSEVTTTPFNKEIVALRNRVAELERALRSIELEARQHSSQYVRSIKSMARMALAGGTGRAKP